MGLSFGKILGPLIGIVLEEKLDFEIVSSQQRENSNDCVGETDAEDSTPKDINQHQQPHKSNIKKCNITADKIIHQTGYPALIFYRIA